MCQINIKVNKRHKRKRVHCFYNNIVSKFQFREQSASNLYKIFGFKMFHDLINEDTIQAFIFQFFKVRTASDCSTVVPVTGNISPYLHQDLIPHSANFIIPEDLKEFPSPTTYIKHTGTIFEIVKE